MELIILNIGLERGMITPTLFTIGVIMAIVTTLMATPIFNLVYGRERAAAARAEDGLGLGLEMKPVGADGGSRKIARRAESPPPRV
jgi:hypothetical protein